MTVSSARARLLAITALFFAAGTCAAGEINLDRSGLALKGYDPVAYFKAGQPIEGKGEFTARHGGASYRFSNQANRDEFTASPEKFVPQYGGYCAYGVASGYKVGIDPEAWTIVDGKLYLNYSQSVRRRWREDIPGHIRKADAEWPALKAK
jgi:YHS domain-containing protein